MKEKTLNSQSESKLLTASALLKTENKLFLNFPFYVLDGRGSSAVLVLLLLSVPRLQQLDVDALYLSHLPRASAVL